LSGFPRSTFYYPPQPESEENLSLLRRLDRLYMDHPSAAAAASRRCWQSTASA
jgi:hypothetical protein